MNDNDKTKEQLINELVKLRQQNSEYKQWIADLTKRQEQFQKATAQAGIVIFSQDKDLRYTYVYNPHSDFTIESVIGKTDAELLSPLDATRLTEIKQRVLDTGIAVREDVQTMIEGEPYHYDLIIDPLYDDSSKEIIGVICISINITDRIQIEITFK